MIECKAPKKVDSSVTWPKVFLAGSIEMGKAVDWQEKVKHSLHDLNVMLLNPRRDDWDSTWHQSINDTFFREQVEWELYWQEHCDYIFMNFVSNTKSPITLLELGLFHKKRIWVCCPEGFWRKGNIEVVCNRYKIPLYTDLDAMIRDFRSLLIMNNGEKSFTVMRELRIEEEAVVKASMAEEAEDIARKDKSLVWKEVWRQDEEDMEYSVE